MSTDTPRAERDVVERLDERFHEIANYCARNATSEVTKRAPEHLALYQDAKDEITRLRAELEQAREALLYAKICMEAQQEISQPELGGFAYPDSPLGKVRAALSSSPGESAKESSEADHG